MTRFEMAVRKILVEALELHNFNVSKTCEYLGIPRPTFYRHVRKYDLPKKQRKARTKKHDAANGGENVMTLPLSKNGLV